MQLLTAALENLPDLVLVVDRKCRIVFSNRSLGGISASALIGKDLLELTPTAHRAAVRGHIASVFGDGRRCIDNEHAVGSGHDRRTYQNVYCPVRGEGSTKVEQVLITSRDVTRRRRLEERLRENTRQLETAQRVAGMGHWIWDTRTDRLHWSPGLYAIAGLPQNTPMDSKAFFAHVHPDDRERVRRAIGEVIRTGRRREFDHRLIRPDGAVRSFHCCAERLDTDGRGAQLVGTARDVTSDKQQALERRTLLAQTRAALRSRDVFLAIAAHELKTPLTTMKLQLQHLLLSGRGALAPLSAARAEEKLRAALDQIDRVHALVERVVELPELIAGEVAVDPRRGELCQIVARTVERHRRDAARRGVMLVTRLPGGVDGEWDARRIEEVLDQLLSNAIKFGAGHPVEVGVEGRGSGARIWVSDQGMGVAPEDRKRIFGRFARAAPDRHYGGVGLGLWVAQQLVHAMDGRIRVSSRPGHGATFWVSLPRIPRGAREQTQQPPAEAEAEARVAASSEAEAAAAV